MVSLHGPITTRASSKADLGRYLSHPNERLPTSTVKEQIFLLTCKAENTETVRLHISLTLALSLDVLAIGETRWYSDNADVVFSVADVSLSSADSRSTVLS